MEIERSKEREQERDGARQEKTGKGQDRIDVPTVMELPGLCRHEFSTRFHSVIRILSVSLYPQARARVCGCVCVRYRLLFSLKNMKYKTAQLFRFCVDDTPREFNSIDVKTQRELAVARFLVTTRREFQCIFPPDVEFYWEVKSLCFLYRGRVYRCTIHICICMYSNRLKDIRS